MITSTSTIRCKATLVKAANPDKGSTWTFFVLPKHASAKLFTLGITTANIVINGRSFQAMLQPDGQKSHWLKVNEGTRKAAGLKADELVSLAIHPAQQETEPRVPVDLRKVLAAAPKGRALWNDITPKARRDWIHWITSAKRAETRVQRIQNACEMLAAGKRRVCCFDRSGIYSKGFSAPKASRSHR